MSLGQVRCLIAEGDVREARRLLFVEGGHTPFANEIDGLLRADLCDEALRRLDLFLNPKFPSVAECDAAYRKAVGGNP